MQRPAPRRGIQGREPAVAPTLGMAPLLGEVDEVAEVRAAKRTTSSRESSPSCPAFDQVMRRERAGRWAENSDTAAPPKSQHCRMEVQSAALLNDLASLLTERLGGEILQMMGRHAQIHAAWGRCPRGSQTSLALVAVKSRQAMVPPTHAVPCLTRKDEGKQTLVKAAFQVQNANQGKRTLVKAACQVQNAREKGPEQEAISGVALLLHAAMAAAQ